MKFEKKFVHCVYDEELVGKTCVFADNIPDLRKHVEQYDDEYFSILQSSILEPGMSEDDLTFPFCMESDSTCYRFVYYDPNLECKIAHEQGKQIQFRAYGNVDGEWIDVDDPMWSDTDEYRVKPEPEPASDDVRAYVPYESVSEMMYEHFNVDCVEDIKNCIWVRPKSDETMRFMITAMDTNEVMVDSIWLNLSQLLDDYLWDDYTVIGKPAK